MPSLSSRTGGNRWHIRCFRCSNCDTPLDSDAHLLQLGDGSLICSNCTYSCTACGNKIEDLAFLTGDQAFCASCFRCRNCKRKIENLRYARTSQGIFCMDCHESLMQRRRKKTRSATVSKKSASAGVKLDKSLPSLPPGLEAPNGPVRTDEPAVSGNNVYPGARPDAAPRASLDSQSATDRAAKQLSSSSSSQQPPANQGMPRNDCRTWVEIVSPDGLAADWPTSQITSYSPQVPIEAIVRR